MRPQRWSHGVRLLAVAGLLAGAAGLASAARFSVNLTRVHLGKSHPVETVALGNEEAQPLNFEVQVKRWTQGADGAWSLAPSDGLVVHPLIVTVPVGGKARVRVGTLAPTTDVEQAYRVELQQLPDPNATADAMQVRMLTRISLPVFVEPPGAESRLALAPSSASADRLGLVLRNEGQAYAPPGEASVRVFDDQGRVLHQGKLTISYVLAGAQLPIATAWPAGACARAAQVELATAEGAALRTVIPAGLRRCAP
jgi:fimbrial chaperone protein